MKRVFGMFEAIFDIIYLLAALVIGIFLLITSPMNTARTLAGIMAIVLVGGDAFHLVPRIALILGKQEEKLRSALGRGKQITSITMTVYYLLLWQIGQVLIKPGISPIWTILIYILAAIRVLLCLLPQNRWQERYAPVIWGIWRNIPFFLMAIMTALCLFLSRASIPAFTWMWLAIFLSFAFYLPVVLWANKHPKIGMLMLPKTCAYLWMLFMCLYL